MKKNLRLLQWTFIATVFFALAYKVYFFWNQKSAWLVDKIQTEGLFEFMSIDVDVPLAIYRFWDILIFFFFCFFVLKIIAFAIKKDAKVRKEASNSIITAILSGVAFMFIAIIAASFFQAANVFLFMLAVIFVLMIILISSARAFPSPKEIVIASGCFSLMLLPFFAISFALGFIWAIAVSISMFLIIAFLAFLVLAFNRMLMLFK